MLIKEMQHETLDQIIRELPDSADAQRNDIINMMFQTTVEHNQVNYAMKLMIDYEAAL